MKFLNKYVLSLFLCIFSINGYGTAIIKGGGANSCAYFLQNQNSNAQVQMWRQWITGFISGANYLADAQKGKNIDEDAFVFELINYCKREPMRSVFEGVIWIYENKL